MSSYFFGLYDIILGYYCRLMAVETVRVIDELNSKLNPDRIVGDDIHKIFHLS
jgi:hypothetical protein